ncbi:MAG: signal peptide peptidase SppA [Deltaproteobacteria bacterium]|nr:signal peptide peptidase SppA [Deltaproteobacteria bacterium]
MKKRPFLWALVVSVVIALLFTGGVALLGDSGEGGSLFREKVGVVEITGAIDNPGPAMLALDKFRRDSSIRAVVLRVDSPGGGVGASQEIYREVERTAMQKPVVCSMGGVAASGGYYVSAPCTKIVANPGTLTGSIGVIATIPDLQNLFDKIGLKLQVIKAGALKGAGQPDRPLSEAERAMLQEVMEDTHAQFLNAVAKGRHMTLEQLKPVSDARVFTGRKAKELGLVDELGNFSDAVHTAARLAGISGRPKLVWPAEQKEPWWLELFKEEAASWLRGVLARAMAPSLEYRWAGGR